MDFNFRGGKANLFSRLTNLKDPRVLPSDICILEVKLDNRMPKWIKNILLKYQLSTQTYSTYTNMVNNILIQKLLLMKC